MESVLRIFVGVMPPLHRRCENVPGGRYKLEPWTLYVPEHEVLSAGFS